MYIHHTKHTYTKSYCIVVHSYLKLIKKMMVKRRQTMDMERPMYDTTLSALLLICMEKYTRFTPSKLYIAHLDWKQIQYNSPSPIRKWMCKISPIPSGVILQGVYTHMSQ